MSKVDWIIGQVFFWLLVVAIVLTGLLGVRRAGAVLSAHQAALVSGRSRYGPAAGLPQAGSDLLTWWGVEPGRAGQVVSVAEDRERRSLLVRIEGWMPGVLGLRGDLGAGSFQRWEEFYPGPPGVFE